MRFALDLLPEGKKKVRIPKVWLALVVLLALSVAGHLGYRMTTHENPVDKLMDQAVALEAEKAAILAETTGVSSGGDISQAVRKVKFLNKLAGRRHFDPLALLRTLESSVPEGAWVDEILFQSGRVILSGGARNLDLIYSMNSSILDSSAFEGVKMNHSAEKFEALGFLTYSFSMALKKE